MAATTWRDMRPARPSGDYLVVGYKFTDGEAVIDGELSERARKAFQAMNIVEVRKRAAPKAAREVEAKPANEKPKSK